MNSNGDRARNLEAAERLVRGAAREGAELVVLPEKWALLGDAETMREGAEPLDGPAITAARGWARELGIELVAGSIAERVEGRDRLSNTSVLIDPSGEISATYRKLHMFDVDVGGVSYRESETEQAGDEVVLADAAGMRLGMTICYDLRFPELYRALAVSGALAFSIPSAFTSETGRAHWEVLLRARAIENQAFVIAANQVGTAPPHYDSFGHSAIVDAWGHVLSVAEPGEDVIVCGLDLAAQARIRDQLPSLANRRPAHFYAERQIDHEGDGKSDVRAGRGVE